MHGNRSFWLAGVFGAVIVAAAYMLHLTRWFGFIDDLLNDPGAPGWIALAVFWIILWVLFALVARLTGALWEKALMRQLREALDALDSFDLTDNIDGSVCNALRYSHPQLGRVREEGYLTSRFRQRVLLLSDRLSDHNRSERISFLLMGRSDIDSAHLKTSYGMLHGLVWALPGLGFMGTAFEMSRAVRGMGSLMGGTNGIEGLRDILVREVIPFLGDAFNITLFALGGSVLCFLLISFVHQQEEGVLISADDAALSLISKIEDDPPPALQAAAHGGLEEVEKRLRELHSALVISGAELSKLNEFIGRSGSAIRAIFTQR